MEEPFLPKIQQSFPEQKFDENIFETADLQQWRNLKRKDIQVDFMHECEEFLQVHARCEYFNLQK